MALWVIRVLFLCLCTAGGLAISQVRPEWLGHPLLFLVAGFQYNALAPQDKNRLQYRLYRLRLALYLYPHLLP